MGKPDDFYVTLERLTPGLRRYARALATGGANDAADDLVQAALRIALEETLPEETRPRDSGDVRIRLYVVLTHVAQRKLRGGTSCRPSLRQPAIMHGLADLAFEERQTLLLVALEGFTYDEVAKITGAERPAVLMRLMRARAALTALDHRPSAGAEGARRAASHLRVVK